MFLQILFPASYIAEMRSDTVACSLVKPLKCCSSVVLAVAVIDKFEVPVVDCLVSASGAVVIEYADVAVVAAAVDAVIAVQRVAVVAAVGVWEIELSAGQYSWELDLTTNHQIDRCV